MRRSTCCRPAPGAGAGRVRRRGGNRAERLPPDDRATDRGFTRAVAPSSRGKKESHAMTAPPTQPLRDEHQELLPHIESLRTAGDAVGTAPAGGGPPGGRCGLRLPGRSPDPARSGRGPGALSRRWKGHGAPEATATMSRDHVEVGRLAEELAVLRGGHRRRDREGRGGALRAVRAVCPGQGALREGGGGVPPAPGCPPQSQRGAGDVRGHGDRGRRGEAPLAVPVRAGACHGTKLMALSGHLRRSPRCSSRRPLVLCQASTDGGRMSSDAQATGTRGRDSGHCPAAAHPVGSLW